MKWSWYGWFVWLALYGGCDSGPSTTTDKPAAPPKIVVLATVYPLADVIKGVGGEHVDVQWLVETGQRPEEIEVGAEVKGKIGRAALIITSGPWDGWMAASLNREVRESRLIEIDRLPAAKDADARAYLWLDPAVVRQLVESVRVHLTAIDPIHEQDYQKNAQAYRQVIDAVDRDLDRSMDPLVGRKLLAVRPVWGALCKRYRVAPLPYAESREENLTPADFKQLAQSGRQYHLKSIFVETTITPAVRQRIEEQTGLKTVTLDALGTSAPDGRSTWEQVVRYDAEQIIRGLE